LLGIFTSFLIPETKRKTLEELTGERDYTVEQPITNIPPEKGEELA